jgi:hypothetical protein
MVEYLKRNLRKGYTQESLKWALVSQGYLKISVERAIEQANKELANEAPVLREKPKIKYEILDENDKPVRVKKSYLQKTTDGIVKLIRKFKSKSF